ncbi:helix-turn-helix domain-containing protein [Lacticaseibacillus thailandensis]|uniref:HTH cro/C1-type domain-containing protein n=1 Tax=Lacticaseibacillus thailandensis DSM 22698 = JCM 13996 TaxID=1423810 RepID=A0A0R2C652_9LACO|nr:helix-turn-helix transcriptional regulator [Lacticaseibacillus thailandensis]KRM87343.1 hypothetical protein FD19_GL000843 [Lacticaseibacillus thailandensis DSM 22698 = JCM 13996]
MHPQIGSVIHKLRTAQGWSVDDLAAGVCPATTLAAIEANTHVPSIETIIGISQRLGIRLNRFDLAANYPVGKNARRNLELSSHIADHDYGAVKKMLNSAAYADAAMSDVQAQAYYFYLGLADLAVDANLDGARYNLHMALAVNHQRSVLTALCYAYVGLVAAQARKVAPLTDAVTNATQMADTVPFNGDVNAVNYVGALAYFQAQDVSRSAELAVATLQLAAQHQQPALLMHTYTLLAQLIRRVAGQPQALRTLNTITDWDNILQF